jgi:hypothetical protein
MQQSVDDSLGVSVSGGRDAAALLLKEVVVEEVTLNMEWDSP